MLQMCITEKKFKHFVEQNLPYSWGIFTSFRQTIFLTSVTVRVSQVFNDSMSNKNSAAM